MIERYVDRDDIFVRIHMGKDLDENYENNKNRFAVDPWTRETYDVYI